jgi:hypothetical protein
MRARSIIAVTLVIAVLGAVLEPPGNIQLRVFGALFWGAIAGGVLFLARWARRSKRGGQPARTAAWPCSDVSSPDPWVDTHGVQRFPGDVFDIENHPEPGANGHI